MMMFRGGSYFATMRVALEEAGVQLYRIMAGLVRLAIGTLTKLVLASPRHHASIVRAKLSRHGFFQEKGSVKGQTDLPSH
jgi:hypothetical protein